MSDKYCVYCVASSLGIIYLVFMLHFLAVGSRKSSFARLIHSFCFSTPAKRVLLLGLEPENGWSNFTITPEHSWRSFTPMPEAVNIAE